MHLWFRAPWRRVVATTIAAAVLGAVPVVPAPAVAAGEGASACTAAAPPPPRLGPATSAAALTATFAGGIDGLVGADYQRTVALPDGRTLWLVQDAIVRGAGGATHLLHNAAVLQVGTCFTLLHGGTRSRPVAWLAGDLTAPLERWFWPLGSTLAADGTLRVFLAEMHERGDTYLTRSEPMATWMATLDPATLALRDLRPAPDRSAALYGWSIASDRHATYLFAQCHRQFGFGFLGHDPCVGEVRVARVRRGALDEAPRYWDGRHWVADATRAVNIAPRTGPDGEARAVNPMQITYAHGRWIAVTKEGDWWGSTTYLDRSSRPTGPWTTTARLHPAPLGDPDDVNTYFASIVAVDWRTVVIGISNNRWDGRPSTTYRPTFSEVPMSTWNRTSPR
jgi:hypothetical protein